MIAGRSISTGPSGATRVSIATCTGACNRTKSLLRSFCSIYSFARTCWMLSAVIGPNSIFGLSLSHVFLFLVMVGGGGVGDD